MNKFYAIQIRYSFSFQILIGEEDVASFFRTLDTNRDGSIDLNEFRVAFERLQ
jgi:hypothetical protein